MTNSSTLLRPSINKNGMTCWIITEGMVGTENQCLAVAESLGLTPDIKRITLRQPWKLLSPWLKFEQSYTFVPALTPPWPDLVIASGRKAIAAARYIKKQSAGKSFTVFLQDPKISPHHFDLVAVPQHDSLRGENVIVTDGAPNRITPEKLEAAKSQFSSLFFKLPSPGVAVLIGGNSRTHQLTSDITEKLVNQLTALNAGLMITTSRRTEPQNQAFIEKALKNKENCYLWDGTGENPYFGMLSWADAIIVTSDSVSMLSDAASTGKPVYVVDLKGNSIRFKRFHDHFKSLGITRPFTGTIENWQYSPVADAQKIANVIKRKLG